MSDYGDRLRIMRVVASVRKQRSYTQHELAKKAGVVRSGISNYESGVSEPAHSGIKKRIREALDWTEEDDRALDVLLRRDYEN